MLALRELLESLFVAASAGIGGDSLELVDVLGGCVFTFVAVVASDVFGVMTADLPIGHNAPRLIPVAVDAVIGDDDRTGERKNGREEYGSQSEWHCMTPVIGIVRSPLQILCRSL